MKMNMNSDLTPVPLEAARARSEEPLMGFITPIPSPLASYGARIDQLARLRQAKRGRQVYKPYVFTPEEIKIVEND